jgi:hypothetical protein
MRVSKMIEVRAKGSGEIDFTGLGVIVGLPDSSVRAPDLESETIRFYGKLGVLESAAGIELGICAYKARPLVVDRMEQHRLSAELLLAVDDEFIMPAAPNIEGANEPDLSKLVALRVRRGEGVVFARGVWHGVPFTLKEESFAVVGFSLDTAQNDMYFRDLDPRVTILA